MSLKPDFGVVNNYCQHRSFDYLYLFKAKGVTLKLEIFDILQKSLFKKTFSIEDLKKKNICHPFKGSYSEFLETLVQKQLLNPQYFSSKERSVNLKNLLNIAKDAIQRFKPKVLVEPEELKDFFCPITLELFHKPVMDNHGHTYEEEAIKNHFEITGKKECPINRQLIKSLSPNLILRQTIEEWQKKDPIPTFSLFKKENTELARSSLQMVGKYIKEEEYKDALESYCKAFKYTKNWQAYKGLPAFFAKMGEVEKTTLAYLYLASYQLEDSKFVEVIKTLENCQSLVESNSPVNLLLFNLYRINNQSEKAFNLAVRMAESLSKQNPKQAITFYKKALRIKPDQFDLYLPFSKLLKNPMDKAHIFLKGAYCALKKGDYEKSESLCQNAYKYSKSSFVDQMLYLQLLHKRKKFSNIKSRLLALAKDYERKKLFDPMIKTYKMLFQIEKKAFHCQKIIFAYDELKKLQNQLNWYFEGLSILIEKKKWKQAEIMALEVLKKTDEREWMSIYEILEKVYTNWDGNKLEELWDVMGKSYIKNNQLNEAEKIYRLALERFNNLDHALQLASILVKRNEKSEGVQKYYEASSLALLKNDLDKLGFCVRNICRIDPKMQFLEINQRMFLLTQKTILTFSKELQKERNRNNILEKKVLLLERKLEVERKKKEFKDKMKKEKIKKLKEAKKIEEKRRQDIKKPFGKAEWAKYYGDVGKEPPLPKNILKILKSLCPIWKNKVEDSWSLVLIPAKVNGRPLTLNNFEGLIKKPKNGNSTEYGIGGHYTRKEFGNIAPSCSYWILLSKDVIPGSREKHYTNQCKLVKEISRKTGILYNVPSALEVAVAISTHYVRSKERLFSNNPPTSTRCQERLSRIHTGWPVVVGNFGPDGFTINLPETHNQYVHKPHGMAVVRKF